MRVSAARSVPCIREEAIPRGRPEAGSAFHLRTGDPPGQPDTWCHHGSVIRPPWRSRPTVIFRIDDLVTPAPPSPCATPVLLIANPAGRWFAAGILENDEDDHSAAPRPRSERADRRLLSSAVNGQRDT